MWAPALGVLLLLGFVIAVEWIETKKRKLMGPSENWRRWFAWHPVIVHDAGKTIWLEWIERRTPCRGWTDYREALPTALPSTE